MGDLVAADVDVLRREEFHHLVEDAEDQAEGLFLAGTEVARAGLAVASEVRIGGKNFGTVTGHLDFGDDGDVPCVGIFDYLFDVFPGE